LPYLSWVKRIVKEKQARDLKFAVHPAWVALMRLCREIGFGEIERIKIQDGVPVMIEQTTKRTILT